MKILYVCKALPNTYKGGIQTHVWELTREMSTLGHEVTILTGGSIRRGTRVDKMAGREVVHLAYLPGRKSPFLPKWLEELSFSIFSFFWVKRQHHHYDIIHTQGRSGALLGKWLPKIKSRLVTTLHAHVETEQGQYDQEGCSLDTWCFEQLAATMEQASLNASRYNIMVSQVLAEQCRQSSSKSCLIPNGIDPIAENSEKARPSDYVVFVGRMEWVKGLKVISEAMKTVSRELRFVMIGEGPRLEEMKQRVEELGLGRRFIFTGGLDRSAVDRWISRSLAVVHPSYYESQGIVILEAYRQSVPVIAARIPAMEALVKHEQSGLLFDAGDPHGLASAINTLHDDRERGKRMGVLGFQNLSNWPSWREVAEQTLGVYQKIMAA